MVTGKIRKTINEFFPYEDLLAATNRGYDVYRLYIGKVARQMDRPWGKRETKPSWGIYKWRNEWMWKDHATEDSGNIVKFVQLKFGITEWKDAVDKIRWDFGIGGQNNIGSPVTWQAPTASEEEEFSAISFDSQPFKKEHHQFWNAAHVQEADCKPFEIYAVRQLAINRRLININPGEPVFAYYAPEVDSAKIYFPKRGQDKFHPKFKNNVPGDYLWNYSRLEGQKLPFLLGNKSVKDMVVASLITPNIISVQSEGAKIFNKEYNPEIVDKINSLSDNIIVAFGSDPDGRKKAAKILLMNRTYKACTPDRILLPEVNDFYSLAVHQDLKAVETLIKSKICQKEKQS